MVFRLRFCAQMDIKAYQAMTQAFQAAFQGMSLLVPPMGSLLPSVPLPALSSVPLPVLSSVPSPSYGPPPPYSPGPSPGPSPAGPTTKRKKVEVVSVSSSSSSSPEVVARPSKRPAVPAAVPAASMPLHSPLPVPPVAHLFPALYDFQKKAVEHLVRADVHGLILAYSTGNGKTRTAINAALMSGLKVLVVTPKSLVSNFKDTLKRDFNHDGDGWSFLTYEEFAKAWRNDQELARNAFLIMDEAHKLRTSIFEACRRCLRQMHVTQQINERRLEKCLSALQHGQSSDDIVDIIDVLDKCGVDIRPNAPLSLCALTAAGTARKVVLLTATPCYNVTEDIVNLVAMVKGLPGAISLHYARTLVRKTNIKEFFGNVFAFADVAHGDAEFPVVKHEQVVLQMTEPYYKEYFRVQTQQSRLMSLSPMFYHHVRAACNALQSDVIRANPKVQWVLEFILEHRELPTMIYSSFKKNGLFVIQEKLDEYGIPYASVMGDMTTKQRENAVELYNKGVINVLFVSDAGSEGLDLKGTRVEILYETEWNASKTEQAAGRGPRRGSHKHLPADERTVTIYQLILDKPTALDTDDEQPLSADRILHNMTRAKSDEIRPFLSLLREVSL